MRKVRLFLLVLGLGAGGLAIYGLPTAAADNAAPASMNGWRLQGQVVSGGAGHLSGGAYGLAGVVSIAGAGQMAGVGYVLSSGPLPAILATVTTTPAPALTNTPEPTSPPSATDTPAPTETTAPPVQAGTQSVFLPLIQR